jgi:hypothetical protein
MWKKTYPGAMCRLCELFQYDFRRLACAILFSDRLHVKKSIDFVPPTRRVSLNLIQT